MSSTFARLCLSATVCVLACASAEPLSTTTTTDSSTAGAETAAVEAARAFQIDYDQELRADPRSFLAVVAAHYLAPGEDLDLALELEPREAGELGFEAKADGLVMRRGPDETRLSAATVVELDARFALGLSPQGPDWRVLVYDRDAPLRTEFPGVAWFPVDPAMIVSARFEADPARAPKSLQTSRGSTKILYLAGSLRFTLGGRALELQAFAYDPEAAPGEPWLVPFRDGTSGGRSYAAGRYLELQAPADGGELTLDFNRATNPLCAYSEHFNCPMPPSFNRLELPIEAGAMAPAAHS